MANDPAADRLSLTIHATLDRLAGDLPRLGIALSGGGYSSGGGRGGSGGQSSGGQSSGGGRPDFDDEIPF